VTGASSGLGAELARSLAARGHDLVLVARRRDRLDAPAQGLRGQGVRVHAIDCDLTEPGAGQYLAAAVAERILEISVLCNNAGAAIAGEFTTYRTERQVAVLRLNLEATVDLCGRSSPRWCGGAAARCSTWARCSAMQRGRPAAPFSMTPGR
jgi:hypothetical protein